MSKSVLQFCHVGVGLYVQWAEHEIASHKPYQMFILFQAHHMTMTQVIQLPHLFIL